MAQRTLPALSMAAAESSAPYRMACRVEPEHEHVHGSCAHERPRPEIDRPLERARHIEVASGVRCDAVGGVSASAAQRGGSTVLAQAAP